MSVLTVSLVVITDVQWGFLGASGLWSKWGSLHGNRDTGTVTPSGVILCTATNPSFFDGRLDDNNMKDVMTGTSPFAPLRLRVKSRTRKTQGCERRERTEIAVYAVCPSIHEISRICSSELYVKSVKSVFICG